MRWQVMRSAPAHRHIPLVTAAGRQQDPGSDDRCRLCSKPESGAGQSAAPLPAREERLQAMPLKDQCTTASRRSVSRLQHDDALKRMDQRATTEAMRRRRCTVEHPFGTLKYRIFSHPRLLMRGLLGAAAEMAIATTVWNLKRAMSILGAKGVRAQLA